MNLSAVRALVVDDEPHVRKYFTLVLGALGLAPCDEAAGVEEARVRHGAHGYDLILLDLNLPGEGGLSWLRELRADGDESVVVMISGQANSSLVLEAAELGADGYLRKDMKREEMAAELRRILGDTLGG